MNLTEYYNSLDPEAKKRCRKLIEGACRCEQVTVYQFVSDWRRVRKKNRQFVATVLSRDENELFPG